MSIERAEELKREWTDQFVAVRHGVPELRRFEGLVGQVQTVNMNCRLLVQFDIPVDISWYDIDPQFLTVVDPKPVRVGTEKSAARPAEAVTDRAIGSAAAATETSGTSQTAATGGSPLEQIRRQAVAKKSSPPTAKSPLETIREQAVSGTTGSDKSQAAAASPLEQIRQQAMSAGASAAGGSPLEQIRAQQSSRSSAAATPPPATAAPADDTTTPVSSTAASTVSDMPAEPPRAVTAATTPVPEAARAADVAPPPVPPAMSGVTRPSVSSPLDQIRAQAGAVASSGDTPTVFEQVRAQAEAED